MAVINDPKMKKFVESKISNDFGLSVAQVATKCKTWGRFKSWLNSDETKIKEVLNIVKSNGVSPAFFASYEKTEGYNSKWGWLNHTVPKGNYTQDADSVSSWIVTQSQNKTDNPAWIDYGNPKDFVPQSVKTEGNAHFKNMASGSIGKVVIAGTAAATWAVYYPNGLLKEYNGVQNYADPITVMYKTIEEWGGSLDGGSSPDPDPNPDPEPEPPKLDFGNVLKFFNDFSDNIVKGIENMLTINLYDYGKSKTFGNSFLKVDKTFDNMYKIKPTLNFDKVITDTVNDAKSKLDDILSNLIPSPDPDPEPDPDPDPDPDPPTDNEMFFPVKIQGGINFWTRPYADNSIQHGMDFGGPRSGGRIHAGYDIGGGGVNHNIYAIRSGEVIFAGSKGNDRGLYIIIKHSSDKKYTLYQHLQFGTNKVKTGDKVKAGQHIAQMGNSPGGYSIHLHLEMNETGVFGAWGTTENPRTYLKVTGNNKTSLPQPK